MRDLPINPRTGNFVDEVAAAYAKHVYATGDRALVFQQFHDSAQCPMHDKCSACA